MLASSWRPFDLPQPWRKSLLADEPQLPTDLNIQPLNSIACATTDLLLAIPDLTAASSQSLDLDVQPETSSETRHDGTSTPVVSVDLEPDFWDQNFVTRPLDNDISPLLTWDTFDDGTARARSSLYTTDRASTDFSALASRLQPCDGTLLQDVVLRALCSLILGRSSVFYDWSDQDQAFKARLQRVAIVGLSAGCTQSIENEALQQGTIYARLRHSVRSRESIVLTALHAALMRILDDIETLVAARMPSITSILQLHALVSDTLPLLKICIDMQTRALEISSDEHVISMLSNIVRDMYHTSDQHAEVLSEVLQAVARPWQDHVMQRIGLAGTGDLSIPPMGFHTLLSEQEQGLLRSIERERSVLQQHQPEHPLCIGSNALSASYADKLDDIVARAAQLERDLQVSIDQHREGHHTRRMSGTVHDSVTDAWTAFDRLDEVSIIMSEQENPAGDALDKLGVGVARMLSHTRAVETITALQSSRTDPAASIRPFLHMQSRLVHRASLSLLFDQHKLSQVIELHRKTFMFCDSGFTQRLREALFEDDHDPTNHPAIPRRRTGLRLNAQSMIKWPPSSSDLSLSLLGILNDSTAADKLSFAVRELSDQEIEQVCDPSSIHALDFVRLQYAATSPLDCMFTHDSSKWYDEIFSTLLLHTRMLHLVTSIHHRFTKREQKHGDAAPYRGRACLIRRVHRLVSVLASHATQSVTGGAWPRLRDVLHKGTALCVPTAGDEVAIAAYSLDFLYNEHMLYLEHTRKNLFIGRRYETVRTAYTQIYALILRHSNGIAGDGSVSQLTTMLDGAEQQLVDNLQAMADKLAGIDSVESEVEADTIAVLLATLR